MSQGRVSANLAVAATVVMLLCLIAGAKYAEAATYMVGDANGWSANVANWPKGKSFVAGDVLVFKYNPTFHNVAVVDQAGYTSCSVPSDAKLFNSGNDSIPLSKGQNFFICAKPGHCARLGMKIAINAA
ncbi:basic blue protein-like [Punica granatum]|uniref:Basic blue protein n=2 Tax=Punica granatum TaxID=22663 RepID=A0A218VTW1_PUNGR|nr:basic blue protein-like [Punica granatum]OWM63935.1 hypothetical protein CDL15_Pgr024772 [Punica granatum]PKI50559.1 hypothetical protein CRG98_029065 [Punica granatum]